MQKERFEYILNAKKRQTSVLKRRCDAIELTNRILSAYLVCLVRRCGSVKIPKEEIKYALEGGVIRLASVGNDYVVSVVGEEKNGVGCEQVSEMA